MTAKAVAPSHDPASVARRVATRIVMRLSSSAMEVGALVLSGCAGGAEVWW